MAQDQGRSSCPMAAPSSSPRGPDWRVRSKAPRVRFVCSSFASRLCDFVRVIRRDVGDLWLGRARAWRPRCQPLSPAAQGNFHRARTRAPDSSPAPGRAFPNGPTLALARLVRTASRAAEIGGEPPVLSASYRAGCRHQRGPWLRCRDAVGPSGRLGGLGAQSGSRWLRLPTRLRLGARVQPFPSQNWRQIALGRLESPGSTRLIEPEP
ncbi:hypothetical protein BDY21DRAFT_38950 [Lineolata rhizophorae]|uniref:Uncharacterized protein n=1 Tax=Lineolata rhizophorae TaxID=578093 RepID=A0A6A6NZZ0_9PEZI|nr:hypothetical protein BDY21DRAFT_38950 [Lineolata rhizophorae]